MAQRLYVTRRDGWRGLTSNEDSVDASIQRLEDYIQKRGGRLITVTRNNPNDTNTGWTTITRKQKMGRKTTLWMFKRLTSDISHKKTWKGIRKWNPERESESLQKAAQNNAVKTNYIKTKLDKTQQNSKCILRSERDKTINHIISEGSKLAQKEYKTWYDWVGKVLHWELCKKWNLTIWLYMYIRLYMYNPESVMENETHKLL